MGYTDADWQEIIRKKKIDLAGFEQAPLTPGRFRRFFGQAPSLPAPDPARGGAVRYPHDFRVLDERKKPETITGRGSRFLQDFFDKRVDYWKMGELWRDQQDELRRRVAADPQGLGKLPPGFAGKANPGNARDYIWEYRPRVSRMPSAQQPFVLYTDEGEIPMGDVGTKGPIMQRFLNALDQGLSYLPYLRDSPHKRLYQQKMQNRKLATEALANFQRFAWYNPEYKMHPSDENLVAEFFADIIQGQNPNMPRSTAKMSARMVLTNNLKDPHLMNDAIEEALSGSGGRFTPEAIEEITQEAEKKFDEKKRKRDKKSKEKPSDDLDDDALSPNPYLEQDWSEDWEDGDKQLTEYQKEHDIDYNLPEVGTPGQIRNGKCEFTQSMFRGSYPKDPNNPEKSIGPAAIKSISNALEQYKKTIHGRKDTHNEPSSVDDMIDFRQKPMDFMKKIIPHVSGSSGVQKKVKSYFNTIAERPDESLDSGHTRLESIAPMFEYLLGNPKHIQNIANSDWGKPLIPNYDPENPHTYFHPRETESRPVIDLTSDNEVQMSSDDPIDLAWSLLKGG